MKKKLKLLKRLQTTRTRIRDAAAGQVAAADAERRNCEREQKRFETMRSDMVEEARTRLTRAGSVTDLEQVSVDIESVDEEISIAEDSVDVALDACDLALSKLRQREQELRMSERLVKEAVTAVAKDEAKNEQAMVDDIVAARRKEGV